jgi:hypothetical protein
MTCKRFVCSTVITLAAFGGTGLFYSFGSAPTAEGAQYVTHTDLITNPKVKRPEYDAANPLSTAYHDPTFGNAVVRITGNPGERVMINGTTPADTGRKPGDTWPRETCHNTAFADASWNADGSLLVLDGCDARFGYLIDGNTFKVLRVRLEGRDGGTSIWDHNDPERMWTVGGRGGDQNAIAEYFPRTDKFNILWTLDGYKKLWIQGQTRKTSNDGKRVGIRAIRKSDGKEVNFMFDLSTGKKGSDILVTAGQSRGALISASGKYVIVRLNAGEGEYDVHDAETGALVFQRRCSSKCERPKHYDTYLFNGRDYLLGGGNHLRRVDLLTGEVFRHDDFSKDIFCDHHSTRNYNDGRWVFTACMSGGKLFANEIIAYRVDGNKKNVVRRLAWHNSARDDYRAEVHVNVSPDSKKAVFASNWAYGTGGDRFVSAYVVLLPDWETPSGGASGGGSVTGF